MNCRDHAEGVTVYELVRYLIRHIKGLIAGALIVAVFGGLVFFVNGTVAVKPQKEFVPGQSETYIAPNESKVQQSSSEMFSLGHVILLIGLGGIVSCGYYILRCIMSTDLLSVEFFRDRYELDFIPWSDNAVKKRVKTKEEIAEFLKIAVEDSGITDVFITGTEFDERDLQLAELITILLKEHGVCVGKARMDTCDKDVVKSVKKAGMIIVVEHVLGSKVPAIDEEMRFVAQYGPGATVKVVLTERSLK